ncbi:DinB family protein [Brevibacillus sp. 179-C9.3 HS]|uniref:DinB family protein n=1 Tax=unclassified Brevibacillus TaxID=2684853 RepID=UPI0039A3C8F4
MKMFFQYNWQVRDEWMEWCTQLAPEELLRERTGGAGTILYTLFHIADVEYSWLRGVQGKPDISVPYEAYKTLDKVRELSDAWRAELRDFIESWSDEMEYEPVKVEWDDEVHTKGELLRHVIAHEIHHMGQLSVWAREVGITPVSANVIGRGLAQRER